MTQPEDVTLGELFRAIEDIKRVIERHLVSHEEFQALRERVTFLERIVFGFIGLIVAAVCVALIRGVVVR